MTRTPRSPTAGILENVRESRRESLAAPERITPRPVLTREDVARLYRIADRNRTTAAIKRDRGVEMAATILEEEAEWLEGVAGVLETYLNERRAA